MPQCRNTRTGLALACLMTLLTACVQPQTKTVTRTVTVPPPALPAELTKQLDYPACRYLYNVELLRCINDTRAAIDRANADRDAVQSALK